MKLTKADLDYLINTLGETDVDQVARAADLKHTSYTLMCGEQPIMKIGRDEAIAILGRNGWLSGLDRSAFHRTASRSDNNGNTVLFKTVFG